MKKLLVSTLLLSVFALSGCALMPLMPSSETPSIPSSETPSSEEPSSSEPSSDPTNEIFEVKFDSKGGSEVQTQYIKYGNKVIRPEDPILESHKFTGWYYLGKSWDFNVDIVKNDLTLYATWSYSPNIEPSEPSEPSIPSSEEVEETTVKVWAAMVEHPVINSIVSKYNETATEKLAVKLTAISESDAGIEIAKDPTQEGAPDLFLTSDDYIYNLQNMNIALNIGGEWKTRIQANNSEVSVLGASYNGNVYGFPVTSDNGYFLWYNKAALTEAQAGSLETILATAKQTGKTVLMDVSNGWYANSFIMSPDACGRESLRWKSVDGRVYYETNWDNEVGVKVSSYINSLLQPYYEDGTLIIGSNQDIIAGFQTGTMIAAVSGAWMEADLFRAMGDTDNLAATKLPTYTIEDKTYQMASFTGSKVYVVNRCSSTNQQKAAIKLAELLTNKDAQIERFETRSTIPCNLEAAADPRVTEHATISSIALNAQNIAGACVQSLTAEGRYWDVGSRIGCAYINGDLGNCANWQEFLTMQMNILRQAV